MGQEVEAKAELEGKRIAGKAFLESDYVLFRAAGATRSGSARVKILFKDIQSLEARDGWLRIGHAGGSLGLELGPRADKWLEKIRSPRNLLDKLGVKPGACVAVLGIADQDFRAQLAARTTEIAEHKPRRDSDFIFFAAAKRSDLTRVKTLSGSLASAGAIWVVYPKGRSEITENDVLTGGKAAGLVDVKVVSFSPTHTALKFVIPVSKR
jgi:hypothetical protein